jgi:hypothetical protein
MAKNDKTTKTPPVETEKRLELPKLPELTSADFTGKPRSSWLLYLCMKDALEIMQTLPEHEANVHTLLVQEATDIGARLLDGEISEEASCARLLQIHQQLRAVAHP